MAGFSSGGIDSTINQSGNLVSPTTDPTFGGLLQTAQASMPQNLPGLQDIIQGGMNSPLLQMVLGPAMARLQAPQAAARQNLTEQTRAAGGLRGSTYGQDQNTLANNQALEGNDLMSQVIKQMLAPIISGQLQQNQQAFNPISALTALLGAAKPIMVPNSSATNSVSGGGGWDSIPQSQGLGTPMQSDSMGATGGYADILRQLQGGSRTSTPAAPPAVGVAPVAPVGPPPQYKPPMPSGAGGGSYDLGQGAGTQYLNSPATPLPGSRGEPIYGEWQNIPTVSQGWW